MDTSDQRRLCHSLVRNLSIAAFYTTSWCLVSVRPLFVKKKVNHREKQELFTENTKMDSGFLCVSFFVFSAVILF